MSLNDVTFIKGQGGLGRPLPGEDYISGILFYNDTLPSGFSSSNRIKQVLSVADAEALGISDDYSDETKAIAKVVIGGTPAVGDTLSVVYTGIDGVAITALDAYALVSGEETTTTTAAAAYAAQINAGTANHGFTATSSTANVLVSTVAGQGVFPNTGTPYAATATGGNTATLTQPTGSGSTVLGVASQRAIYHYHISEYFRLQPQGYLYIGIYALTAIDYAFSAITLMQNFSNGKIRQIGVYINSTAFTTTHVNSLQTIATALEAAHKPLSIVYGGNIQAVSDLSTLTTLATLSDKNVSVVIGQDGAALGYTLFKATAKSITNLGAVLGLISLSKVSEDIGWVGNFNMVTGTELEVPAFANGQLFSVISDSLLSSIDLKRYIFVRSITGKVGTWVNDSHTAISLTSDYAYIENERTIDKAIRVIRPPLIDAVNGPIVFKSDGTMTDATIAYLTGLPEANLDQMVRDGELSAYSVIIDTTQKPQTASKIVVAVELIGIGVARDITVNIGYVISL